MQFTSVFYAMPFNLNPFFKLLYSVLPYRQATIDLPFPKEVVRQRLAAKVPTGLIGETPTILGGGVPYRYKIKLDGYSLRATGPYGNRRWCLVTAGKIQDIPGGSVLQLKMRLSSFNIVVVFVSFLSLGWFWGGIYFIKKIPLETLPIILIQTLFMYTVLVYVFRYEAERTLEVLKAAIFSQKSG
ncbi:MAG TPA: hypothetical protein VLA84_03565 [Microcoleus sp.]|nr:hypothetical protein [Microcoleus sp.]